MRSLGSAFQPVDAVGLEAAEPAVALPADPVVAADRRHIAADSSTLRRTASRRCARRSSSCSDIDDLLNSGGPDCQQARQF
jgi:hypothetical protein